LGRSLAFFAFLEARWPLAGFVDELSEFSEEELPELLRFRLLVAG